MLARRPPMGIRTGGCGKPPRGRAAVLVIFLLPGPKAVLANCQKRAYTRFVHGVGRGYFFR